MNAEQRQPYQNMAQLARSGYNPTRVTTDGLEIDELERQDQRNFEEQQLMKKRIEDCVRNACDNNGKIFFLAMITFLIKKKNNVRHVLSSIYACQV